MNEGPNNLIAELRSGRGPFPIRLGVVVATSLLHILLFLLFNKSAGTGLVSFVTVPVVLANWFFGVRIGLLTALIGLGVNNLLLMWIGPNVFDWEIIIRSLPGGLTLVLLGFIVGTWRQSRERTLLEFQKRRQAEETLKIRIEYDESLLRLSRQLELTHTYQEMIQVAWDEVQKILPFNNVWVYLDGGDDSITYLTGAGPVAQLASSKFSSFRIKGDAFLEEVRRSKETLVVLDAQTDPRIDKDVIAKLGNRTIIIVPMMIRMQLLGFWGTGSFGDEGIRPPTPGQLEYFSAMAAHIAVAISRIQLLDELEDRVRFSISLNMMTRTALEAAGLDEMLQELVNRMANLFDADACYLTFWDHVHCIPIPMAAFGPLQDTYRKVQPESDETALTDSILQAEHALVVEDVSTSAYLGPNLAKKYPNPTVLGLPLIAGKQKLGAIILGYDQPRTFPVTEIIRAEQAAAQIALAIARTQLLEAERHRREESETLREATSALVAILDLNQILETLLASLRRVVPYDSACVFLIEGDEVHAMAAAGHPIPELILNKRFPLQDDQLLPEIYNIGESLILQDAQADPRFRNWGETNYVRGWMGIPLWAKGEIIGVMTIDSRLPGAYSSTEAVLALAFANQAGIALHNAHLLESERHRREEAETLRQLAMTFVETFDLDEVLERILSRVQQVIPYDSAHINLIEGGILKVVAYHGFRFKGQERISLEIHKLPHLQNAIQEQRPVIISDTHNDPRWIIFSGVEYIRCWMGVPLVVKDQVIGLLNFDKETRNFYTQEHASFAQIFAGQAAVAIENARLFEETLQRQKELTTLLKISKTVSSSLDLKEVLEQVAISIAQLLNLEWSSLSILDPVTNSLQTEVEFSSHEGIIATEIGKAYNLVDYPATVQILRTKQPLVIHINDSESDPSERALLQELEVASALLVPLAVAGRTVGLAEMFIEDETRMFTPEEVRLAQALGDQAAIAIANAQLFSETRQHLSELETVNRISKKLRAAQGLGDMLPTLMDETLAILSISAGIIWLYNPMTQLLHSTAARGWFTLLREAEQKPRKGIAGKVFQTGEVYRTTSFSTDQNVVETIRDQIPPDWGGVCVPLRASEDIIGVFFVSVRSPRVLTEQEIHLLETISEIAGNAIHRVQLNGMIQHQLKRLLALRAVDSAISSSLDLRLTLNLLIKHVLSELDVDAACILLAEPLMYRLQFASGEGFFSTNFQHIAVPFGEGLAGRVAEERTPITVTDLNKTDKFPRSSMMQEDGFVFYTGIPLIAKGQVKGVLEIFQRKKFFPPPDWLDFMDALAAQAAIAIDSAQLFAELQRSNMEITLAYDNTLEGWVRMLDLRDRETEGHTQRVTDLTLDLARKVGFPEKDMIHVRRGALLHDIGKMGIPDRILLKPGPLTEEEWAIMHQHPQIAFDMLSPIPFLHPALDIPYYHHEKWDGTGYPQKLRGLAIPLAARMFSIVDVWDALTNDRPYRKAWSEERTYAYMLEQSGIYFDPEILQTFLKLLDTYG